MDPRTSSANNTQTQEDQLALGSARTTSRTLRLSERALWFEGKGPQGADARYREHGLSREARKRDQRELRALGLIRSKHVKDRRKTRGRGRPRTLRNEVTLAYFAWIEDSFLVEPRVRAQAAELLARRSAAERYAHKHRSRIRSTIEGGPSKDQIKNIPSTDPSSPLPPEREDPFEEVKRRLKRWEEELSTDLDPRGSTPKSQPGREPSPASERPPPDPPPVPIIRLATAGRRRWEPTNTEWTFDEEA